MDRLDHVGVGTQVLCPADVALLDHERRKQRPRQEDRYAPDAAHLGHGRGPSAELLTPGQLAQRLDRDQRHIGGVDEDAAGLGCDRREPAAQ